MNLFVPIWVFLLVVVHCKSEELPHVKTPHTEKETPEAKLRAIDKQLNQLAHFNMRSGTGSIGYRSHWHRHSLPNEWIQINLSQETTIDCIVLVPAIRRDTENGFQSDCFPLRFRVLAGSNKNQHGREIARFDHTDNLLPRIAPLIISVDKIQASWVRIEVDELTPRAFDGNYVLQLSEFMIFSGLLNVAMNRPVQVPENFKPPQQGWSVAALTDGALPYLMDAATGEQSIAFLSKPFASMDKNASSPTLRIDLGQPYAIDAIHLHPIEQNDTVPQGYSGNYGIPEILRIEGSAHPDFSEAKILIENTTTDTQTSQPVLIWNLPATHCRYVRLLAIRPPEISDTEWAQQKIGFAEIELFTRHQNVALGKPFEINIFQPNANISNRQLQALTDGRNLYGDILPQRQWMQELALRHELEKQRPFVIAEISTNYSNQKQRLKTMSWLAAILAVGIVVAILIERIVHLREVACLRERFAADLHDEIGANIHSIGLLSDAAQASHDSPHDWKLLHGRIRKLTERTGVAIRNCVNILEAKELYQGLADDIRREARRNMAQFEHKITIEGEEHLSLLKQRTRVDLFLFYKECLVNISRHSGANQFATKLHATPNRITLTVSDNGKGLTASPGENLPHSLKRRAKLLKASIQKDVIPERGTSITLTLKHKRFTFNSKF